MTRAESQRESRVQVAKESWHKEVLKPPTSTIEAPQNLKTQAERDLAPKALLQLCFKVFRKRQIELYYGFHTFSLGFCIEG